jgi:hypothetical protein
MIVTYLSLDEVISESGEQEAQYYRGDNISGLGVFPLDDVDEG